MRRRMKAYALLMSIIMVLSLLSTNFVMVKAQEQEQQNIAVLKDSATEITGKGTYSITKAEGSYTVESDADWVEEGALIKVTLEPHEGYRILSEYACFSSYTEEELGKFSLNQFCYDETAVYNATDVDRVYYLWVTNNAENDAITVEVSDLEFVTSFKDTPLTVDGAPVPVINNDIVGYFLSPWYDDDWNIENYEIDVLSCKLFSIEVPADETYYVNLEYAGEDLIGKVEEPEGINAVCYLVDEDNKQITNIWGGGSGFENSMVDLTVDNIGNSDSRKVYILVSIIQEGEQGLQLSVTRESKTPNVNELINEALDISEYDTYSGNMTSEKYDVAGMNVSRGKLVKVDVKQNQKIEVSFGNDLYAYRLAKINNELVFDIGCFGNSDVVANKNSDTETYYYWIFDNFDEVETYSVTTTCSKVPFLSEIEENAIMLNVGDNTIRKYGNTWTFVEVGEDYYYSEEAEKYIRVPHSSVEMGSVYKFEIPAMEQATFVFKTDNISEDIVGPYIYDPFSANYGWQMGYFVFEEGDYDYREYTVDNISDKPMSVGIVMPDYHFVEDEVVLNISTEPVVLPEMEDDALYVISWNDELSMRMELFYEKYPEYADKVKYLNLDCSGTSDYVEYAKVLAKETADNTAIFAMDKDVLDILLPSEDFVSLESIGVDLSKYDNAYDYTVKLGSVDDELKAAAWEVAPGNFVYDTAIAQEVLGTSDPTEVQAYISDPEKFIETAKKMKEAGYYMTSGEDVLDVVAKDTCNPEEAVALADAISKGRYSTGNVSWSSGWYDDMISGDVFGFFGCTWFMHWSMEYSDDIDMAMCEGPVAYPWGGSFIAVSSSHENKENDELATFVIETLCCDEEYLYELVEDEEIVIPNNQVVTEKLIADGKGAKEELANSQNPLPVWHNVAKNIGKDNKVYVSEIKLNVSSTALNEGATTTLTAKVTPDNAINKTVTWTSSNSSVATVDANGKVTAVKAGTATITATAKDGSGKKATCEVTVKSSKVLASEILISNDLVFLNIGDIQALSATVFPENATNKNVTWLSSDSKIATVNSKGEVTAIAPGKVTITATAVDGSGVKDSITVTVEKPVEITPNVDVTYHTHIQTLGDSQGTKKNGEMAGTSGMAKRLENIWIKVDGNDNLGIQYTTHCQTYGWMPWSCDGEANGTSKESKRLEAIKIQLTGADKDKYDVYYRVHAQSYGWLGWAKNGEPSGTAGYGKRLEGIQVVVVKKGEAAPGLKYAGVDGSSSKYGKQAYVAKTNEAIKIPGNIGEPNVMYQTHVQTYGWQKWMVNGQMSGTSGKSKRLEGINIKLTNAPYEGDIVYTTHVQKYGWKDGKPTDAKSTWKKNGEMSGTNGEAKRLEAICIDLTGEMAEHYDVYYRVHAQTFGWLGWAKNGEESGTAGYAKRLEGIQIVLVEKGGKAPADNYGGIDSKNNKPFIEKK